MSFYERFYSFRALSIIGKCTSRHLFAYGGLFLIVNWDCYEFVEASDSLIRKHKKLVIYCNCERESK